MRIFKSEKGKQAVLESYNRLTDAWGVDKEEQVIETRFGKTHVFLTGNKLNPPIILFHGVGDNSAVMWVLNIQELSNHFYCIAVDTLGGPGKSEPNAHYNKKEFDQVTWINELANALKLDKFHVVGVSHGAYLAYLYTTKEKERVINTVCIEGGMIINPYKSMIGTLLLAFPEILFPTKKNMIKILKKMKPSSALFENSPQVIDHMILVMKNHNQSAMFPHRIEKYDKNSGITINDKIYFLLGGNLQGSRDEYTKLLEEGNYKYKIFEGVGHGLNHEEPELVNKEIVNFLKKNDHLTLDE